MNFRDQLSVKEQAALDKHIVEIEKHRDIEISKGERAVITYRYIKDVVIPKRQDTRQRRAMRKESRRISHDSRLSWSFSRPPRVTSTR